MFLTDQVLEVKVRSLILVLWLADYTFSLNAWQSDLRVLVIGSSDLSQIFPGLFCSKVYQQFSEFCSELQPHVFACFYYVAIRAMI